MLNVDCFYYFGKLETDSEFVGSAPSVVKDLLDRWAIDLNRQDYPMPRWAEFALFNMPEKDYQSFYSGMFWNSGDSKNRKYPFVLYWVIENRETSNFLASRFNGDSFFELVHSQWQFLLNVNLNNVKVALCRDGRIARFTGNMLRTVDSPEPTLALEPDVEGEHVKLFSSVKKEWMKRMREFPIEKICDGKLDLYETTTGSPSYLAFPEKTAFHRFIAKSLCKV